MSVISTVFTLLMTTTMSVGLDTSGLKLPFNVIQRAQTGTSDMVLRDDGQSQASARTRQLITHMSHKCPFYLPQGIMESTKAICPL